MAVVEVRDLSKRFDGVAAVDGIDLASADGEFLVLLGPSGCGKTTLLRMIGGLEPPTSGDILIGGRVVTDLPPRARQIAMVFQSYALYPHMTVYNNIAFPLKAAGLSKAEQARRVAWAAGILGIDAYLDRKPRQLSGGQRQRVALARALVSRPRVLILDDSLSSVDAETERQILEQLEAVMRGRTSILISHRVAAVRRAHQIAVIEGGRLVERGSHQELLAQGGVYADLYRTQLEEELAA
jgi:multiple sugar transport system ATP-binding protein